MSVLDEMEANGQPMDGKIHVHVDNLSEVQPVVSTQEKEPEHFVCSTFVLQAVVTQSNYGGGTQRQDIAQILEIDPQRKDAGILINDNPVVLCDTYRKAQDAANTGATVPNPQGAYIPAGGNASVSGTGPMWAVSTVPASPTRVSVIINRRGSAT